MYISPRTIHSEDLKQTVEYKIAKESKEKDIPSLGTTQDKYLGF